MSIRDLTALLVAIAAVLQAVNVLVLLVIRAELEHERRLARMRRSLERANPQR